MSLFSKLEKFSWQAQEVVREINDRPHLLVRIDISGTYFPHRAPEPFVRIVVGKGQAVSSWFANVSDDNRRIVGYFQVDLPQQGTLEFGYGNEVMGRLPAKFESKAVNRLDRKRVPKDVVVVSAKHLKIEM